MNVLIFFTVIGSMKTKKIHKRFFIVEKGSSDSKIL